MKKVSLCASCAACPEVTITQSEVTIGEDDNLVRLKLDEWETLKQKIKNDEI